MIDQILTDRVVLVCREGDLELGADSVDAGNEDGIFNAALFEVGTKHPAETADPAEHLGSVGGAY